MATFYFGLCGWSRLVVKEKYPVTEKSIVFLAFMSVVWFSGKNLGW